MAAHAGARRLRPVRHTGPTESAVIVRPSPGGWRVDAGAWSEPTMFLSGHAAECAADRLAQAIASCGEGVRVEIYDRRYLLAGVRRIRGADGAAQVVTAFPAGPW